jgi:arylamine N-acetyltransferase
MKNAVEPTKADLALRLFLTHTGLDPDTPPETLLRQVITAFAQLPYENLTKILKEAQTSSPDQARRQAIEVIRDHVHMGTGGTCFSLTATLLHLLRNLGWAAEPILADRPYGANTHCALLVSIKGQPHLVDPGFLLTEPIPLPRHHPQRIPTSFHDVLLTPEDGGSRLQLHTVQHERATPRITFKTEPVDWGQFLKVWDSSFGWDMMRYPVLSRVAEGQHLYLRGNRLQTRSREAVHHHEIAPMELVHRIAAAFGIQPGVTARALAILSRRGEKHDRAPVA